MIISRTWLCAIALLSVLFAKVPSAQAQELSDFERETRAAVLSDAGLVLDPAPSGKLIEGLDIFVIDPFDDRDPVPGFVNLLHVNSREYVVRQELAVSVGTGFVQRLIDDSVQSLRATQKFSLVLVVAARGSTAQRVRVVVIVKDVWSLRLNWDGQLINARRDRLLLNPSEVNLFGTHATLGGLYVLEPDRVSMGGNFFKPQIADSNIGIYLSGGVIFERGSGENEGSYGFFQYYKPFKSSFERWAWSVGMGWRDEVTRRYQGVDIRTVEVDGPSGDVEHIPEVFETDRLAGEYELKRSFGTLNKTELSLGVEADRRRYRTTPDISSFSPAAQRAFERRVLPTSETRISPFAQVRARSTRFQRLVDVETLSLQEDLWLGHDALLRVYPASHRVGSSRSLLGIEWAFGYSLALGTGLARAMLKTNIELAEAGNNDVEFETGARLVSPKTVVGRMHLDVLALDRYRNYLNRPDYVLGGQNRLRGYEFSAFQGSKVVALNFEYRSVPVEVLGAHVAGAAFYDAGDAYDSDRLHFKQSIGLGCRVLFPQFDRTVLRVDWGVPVQDETRGLPGGVSFAFGQAFSLPLLDEPSVLDGVLPF